MHIGFALDGPNRNHSSPARFCRNVWPFRLCISMLLWILFGPRVLHAMPLEALGPTGAWGAGTSSPVGICCKQKNDTWTGPMALGMCSYFAKLLLSDS